ncbi:MAG TPA: sigma-70 family RNA polymerase sigma factor [Gemmatimonadales bacterium]|jgi:RNA polymerase sigma factor (TIGR02999 family)|nr:sigma-70 family RNA polymerase sigma factor [Gemmatimonadales bacterium]
MSDITGLLVAWRGGDQAAFDQLFPLVYDDLRQMAHRHLARERLDHSLATTDLVHEAYLRLVDQRRVDWVDRAHFLGVAAQAMRRILVDYARRYQAQKRGGKRQRVTLDDGIAVADERADLLVALDEALDRLRGVDERLAQVVELRFFGGLSEPEAAEILGVTDRTIRRDWVKAKGWLHQAVQE